MHMHRDRDKSVEPLLSKGSVCLVHTFAESAMVRLGIRHGYMHWIPREQAPPGRLRSPCRRINRSIMADLKWCRGYAASRVGPDLDDPRGLR